MYETTDELFLAIFSKLNDSNTSIMQRKYLFLISIKPIKNTLCYKPLQLI